MSKEVLEIQARRSANHNGTEGQLSVPLLDISGENKTLHKELTAVMTRVLSSGWFVLGPEVESLEQEIAQRCGVTHAVGCASGSDALLLALMACNIGPGDEVIVPSFTFFATASCVSRLGATPIFADIDRRSFNITAATVEPLITSRTKAVIPVHLFGQAAGMDPIVELARAHKLVVIEDAAQAIGANCGGRPVGSIGHMGCFSFYPTKNLGGFGDGGMLTTTDASLAERLRLLRGHGMQPRYYHQEIGINSRLDALQAAMLRVKLPHLGAFTLRRRENAVRYLQLFADAGLDQVLGLPTTDQPSQHVWNQFTIRVPRESVDGAHRDGLRSYLANERIGTEIYYPIPLHEQACFASLGYSASDLPETTRAAREVLSLPIHPGLNVDQQVYVVRSIARYLSDCAARVPAA
jgi:dTDP-4-amino-4,6-dideoxygalactose transaminase